jgi:methionyl-tRNA synthetase
MTSNKVFYITTPIYYVNADPHIGHVFSTLIADCLSRYHKMSGKEVFFVTGTDEHGQKVEQKAKSLGKSPKQFTDEISQNFKNCFENLGFEYDRFIRTTDQDHENEVKKLWEILEKNGDIYLGNYEGWYSITDETFVTDSSVVDGVDPVTKEPCKVFSETGGKVIKAKEENYMFRLSKYQDKILKWLETSPIIPEYRNQEMINFVKEGLKDLSISRKKTVTEWGIEVPGNQDSVIYVWLDALTNYKTAANNDKGKNIFPADIHVVGKDILKFHAVYWIGFLLSANLPLPGKILAHGWWLCGGQKMSKSVGNIINPAEIANKYGNDVLRYVLLRESSFGSDSSYTEDILISRLNADLANNLGNLVSRCLGSKLNPDGKVPKKPDFEQLSEKDLKLMEVFTKTVEKCNNYMKIPDIQNYISTLWDFISEVNVYFTDEKPWKLIIENPERFKVVQYNMLEYLRTIAIMASPILVDSSKKILEYLKVDVFAEDGGLLKEGQDITTFEKGKFPNLFERVVTK